MVGLENDVAFVERMIFSSVFAIHFESTAGWRQHYASLSNIAPGETGLATSRWTYRNPQALCH